MSSLILHLAGLLAVCNLATAIYDMSETCTYYGDGYIGDPHNCQGWGFCKEGRLIQSGLCNKGYLYDTRKGICNLAADVTCRNTVEQICSSLNTNKIIADPLNCNRVCYCKNKVVECRECPSMQIFNITAIACQYPSGNKHSCTQDSVCRLVPNNKFVSDPDNCGSYLRCLDGLGLEGSCENKLKFSPLLGGCSSDDSYCTGHVNSNAGTGLPPSRNKEICQTSGGKKFLPDGSTCYGYYYCTSTTSVGIWGKCITGTHFNGDCVTPYTFDCAFDRCGNINATFVADLGCKTYSQCANGTTVSSGHSCAAINPEYPYFDEYLGGCVVAKPNYAVCQSAATPTAAADTETRTTVATSTVTVTTTLAPAGSAPTTIAGTTTI